MVHKGSGAFGIFSRYGRNKGTGGQIRNPRTHQSRSIPQAQERHHLQSNRERGQTESWVKSEEAGIKPLQVEPYGGGFMILYLPKKDKIELTPM